MNQPHCLFFYAIHDIVCDINSSVYFIFVCLRVYKCTVLAWGHGDPKTASEALKLALQMILNNRVGKKT